MGGTLFRYTLTDLTTFTDFKWSGLTFEREMEGYHPVGSIINDPEDQHRCRVLALTPDIYKGK